MKEKNERHLEGKILSYMISRNRKFTLTSYLTTQEKRLQTMLICFRSYFSRPAYCLNSHKHCHCKMPLHFPYKKQLNSDGLVILTWKSLQILFLNLQIRLTDLTYNALELFQCQWKFVSIPCFFVVHGVLRKKDWFTGFEFIKKIESRKNSE